MSIIPEVEFTGLNRTDRDLLISLDTRVRLMADDIKEIKEGTKERLGDLEREKLDVAVFNIELKIANDTHIDIEKRTRNLEQFRWLATGGLILLNVITVLLLKFYKP